MRKARRLLYHPTLGLRVMKKKKQKIGMFTLRIDSQLSTPYEIRRDPLGPYGRAENLSNSGFSKLGVAGGWVPG